jgi:hypothetical protein
MIHAVDIQIRNDVSDLAIFRIDAHGTDGSVETMLHYDH